MAFTSISSTLINVGKAVKREIFTLTKDNLDDHETRINNLEGGQSRVNVFNSNVLIGSFAPTYTGVAYYKATSAFNLTSANIQIYEKNGIASGILEIDIKTGPDPDDVNMDSIFSVLPSLDYSVVTDYEISTNQIINPSFSSVSEGDWLRLDITSLPLGVYVLYVQLYGEVQ